MHRSLRTAHAQADAEQNPAADTPAQGTAALNLLSAKQFKRLQRQGCEIMALQVKAVDESAIDLSKVDDEAKPLVREFADVFREKAPGLPPDRGVAHTIPLKEGAEPVATPMFRYSPVELAEIKRQITELLEAGLIEPSTSAFGAPVLFVQKKDGSLRMCIDYRRLNNITKKNKYPIPRIDELLDQLQGAQCFSLVDLTAGYHQIRIAEEDVEKTAFRTPYGLYQFKVLSFGLTNAPSCFQNVMNKIFSDMIGKTVLIYLDDILIFSKSKREHEEHLRRVLGRLRKHQLYAKLSKCSFFQQQLKYLGHVVTHDGVKVDPDKVAAVATWEEPTNVPELRKFLGFANYFRKFLKGYAKHVAPLNTLLKNGVNWHWAAAEQAAFAWAKNALQTAPVLAMPNFAEPFEVRCDASGFGTGAVLMQGDRAVAYLSKGFTAAERNYTTGEQELLAVVRALASWRCYLEGGAHPVTVVTDHQPLTYMPTKGHLSRRQARWSEFLSRFHLIWEHRPGRTNIADPLSRKPSLMLAAMSTRAASSARRTPERERPSSADIESEFEAKLRASYEVDEWLKMPKSQRVVTYKHGFWWYSKNKEVDLLYIPDIDDLRAECLKLVHDHPFSGHGGITKTTEQIQRCWSALACAPR